MSADNLYLVRRAAGPDGDRFAVSMEFASSFWDDELDSYVDTRSTPIDDPRVVWFDSLDAACEYAGAEYSEYGVHVDVAGDSSGDTRAARLLAGARKLAADLDDGGLWNSARPGADGSVTVAGEFASFTIRTRDGDPAAAWRLADWLTATSPEHLIAILDASSRA